MILRPKGPSYLVAECEESLPTLSPHLCQVTQFVAFQSLEILLLQQNINALLDIRNAGLEAVLDLLDGFRNELLVLHLLARLHDANNGGL